MAAALLLLHALLAWLARYAAVDLVGDSARYVLLARSLVELDYRELWRVGAPLHGKYPPLYPAVLAVWGRLFGWTPATLVVPGVLLSTGTLALVFDAVRRRWSPHLALACLLALAPHPWLVGRAGTLLSEPLYAFLTVLALWALAVERPGRRRLLVAGGAAVAAALTRNVGATLVFALCLHWLLERRLLAAGTLAGAAALVLLPLLLGPSLAPPGTFGETYAGDLPAEVAGAAGDAAAGSGSRALPERVLRNTRRYASLAPDVLGLPEPPAGRRAVQVVAALAVLAGVAGIGRRWRPAALYLIAYGALLLGWTWPVRRLLEVVVPLLVPGVVLAAAAAARRWVPRGTAAIRARWAAGAIAGLIAAGAAAQTARLVPERLACDGLGLEDPDPDCFPSPLHERLGLPPGSLHERLFWAMALVDRVAAPDAILLTERDAPTHYYTGLRTLTFADVLSEDTADLVPVLRRRGVDYVLYHSMSPRLHGAVWERLLRGCDSFRVAGRRDGTLLLELRGRATAREAPSEAGDACPALEETAPPEARASSPS